MIYRVASTTIESASQPDAREIISSGRKLIQKHFPDQQGEILYSLTGRENRVMWIGKFESMAAAEEFNNALAANEEWRALMTKNVRAEADRGRSYWVDAWTIEYWAVEEA